MISQYVTILVLSNGHFIKNLSIGIDSHSLATTSFFDKEIDFLFFIFLA
jgi:hypothetical protein